MISPEIERDVGKTLGKLNFVSLITDASNRKADKMLPVMVRGFDEEKGVVVHKLAVKFIANEKSETIENVLLDTGKDWKISDKIVAFAADNCNTNFGGPERRGENNVFYRLKQALGRDIVGSGCVSHIIHNASDCGCLQLPIDIEALVVKIYKHFNLYTVRVETLKKFCADADVTYSKLVNHSGTRFLSLHPATKMIIEMFEPLRNYFENLNNCPATIQRFFEDEELALFWLHFLDSQLELNNDYVLRSETKKGASFEISALVSELHIRVKTRKENMFIPFKARTIFDQQLPAVMKRLETYMKKFYTAVDSYLETWSKSLDGTEIFAWMNLTAVPAWSQDVEPSLLFAIRRIGPDVIKADLVFDEFHSITQLVSDLLPSWTETDATSEGRWLEIFKRMTQEHRPINQLSLLVQYAFSIPGTSTEVERLFSTVNDIWSTDKGQMQPGTLEAILNVKINTDLDCLQYYEAAKKNKSLLSKVQSSEKYKNQASANDGPSTSRTTQAAPTQAGTVNVSDESDDDF